MQQRALQLLEPCRAVPSFLRGVHPWDPLAQSKRPSLVVTWLLCAKAAGRCHQRLGGTSGNPPATAEAIAAVRIARERYAPGVTFTTLRR